MCPECSLHVGYILLLLKSLLHVSMAHLASASQTGPWSLRYGGLTKMTIGLEHTCGAIIGGRQRRELTDSSIASPSPHFVILGSPPQGDMDHQPLRIATPSLQALGVFQPSLVFSSQE